MNGNSPQVASSSNTPILNNLIKPTNQNAEPSTNQNTNHIRSNVIKRTQSPQTTNIVQKVNASIQPRPNQNQQTKLYSEALSRAASSLQNLPQNIKNHPIALEMIRLVNVIGINQQGQKVASKKLQFQGIVKMVNNQNVNNQKIQIRKLAMTGKKLTFNQKLQEMQVGLSCSLATQNHCTFDGKINVKKARVFEVARQVQLTKKFESVQNVTSNALYDPLINVLSPHTCISKTEYIPVSVLYRQPAGPARQSSTFSRGTSGARPIASANQIIAPIDSIQNRKRKRNSDSDSSCDEADTGGHRAQTRKEAKLREIELKESLAMHKCYYNDLESDYEIVEGTQTDCKLCNKEKTIKRMFRVDLSQSFIKSHNFEQKLEKMDQDTKPLMVKVDRLDDEYLANLRKMSTVLPNIGQTKNKKKIKWFENPEIDEEPLLTFNRRTHSHVSDIEYYQTNGRYIMMNKSCNVLNRKRKNKNRDHMLIEKFLGMYDPDCTISYPLEGICWFCGIEIEPPDTQKETDICKSLCDFCHDKWSELNNSKKALDERKQDKKKIRLYKKQHITGPKPPKKSDNKCPRIIIHERSKGSDDESDDDEDRYSVTSWRKNFSTLGSITKSNFVQDQDADDVPGEDDEDEFVPDEI